MRTNMKISITHHLLALTFVAAMSAMSPVHAQTAVAGKLKIVAADPNGSETLGDKQTIEVHLDNGKLTVIRNGKEVDSSQVKLDGNRVVILDKDGNELKGFDFNVGGAGAGQVWVGAGNGGDAETLFDKVAVADGPAPKVMVGVHMTETTPALEYHLGLEHGKTTLIAGVMEGMPAFNAGIRQYDIITRIDGKAPADTTTIHDTLKDKEPGDIVNLTIIHEGRTKQVSVTLQAYDAEAMQKAKLLGSAAEAQTWSYSIPKLQEFGKDFGNFKQHIFVAPDGDVQKYLDLIKPQIEQHMRDHIQQNAAPDKEGVDDELNRLDKRMAELERLLQELVKKAEHGR